MLVRGHHAKMILLWPAVSGCVDDLKPSSASYMDVLGMGLNVSEETLSDVSDSSDVSDFRSVGTFALTFWSRERSLVTLSDTHSL
jgi:hypothetical protein